LIHNRSKAFCYSLKRRQNLYSPPGFFFNGYRKHFPLKRLGREADSSPLSSTKNKNNRSYTSTSPLFVVELIRTTLPSAYLIISKTAKLEGKTLWPCALTFCLKRLLETFLNYKLRRMLLHYACRTEEWSNDKAVHNIETVSRFSKRKIGNQNDFHT
jgi:hypothetical protein